MEIRTRQRKYGRLAKTNMIKVAAFVLLVSVLTSCGNGKLSRGEAKDVINETLKNRCEHESIIKSYSVVIEREALLVRELSPKEKSYLDALENEGLINRTVERKEGTPGFYRRNIWDEYTVTLTEKGREYAVPDQNNPNLVNLYCVEVDEVTGIKMEDNSENTAIVKYKVKVENKTPFFTLLPNGRLEFNPQQEYEAKFVKYDDGWRIEGGRQR